MGKVLDRGLLKRDVQGLMGICIAINDINEREQLETLLKSVEAIHKRVVQHLAPPKDNFETPVEVHLASNDKVGPQPK